MFCRVKDVNRIPNQNVVLYFDEPNGLPQEIGPSTKIPDPSASFEDVMCGRARGLVSPIDDDQISVLWTIHNIARPDDELTECA
jgi:hypothetical protein